MSETQPRTQASYAFYWPALISIIMNLLGGAYVLFAKNAVEHTVSGGSIAMWITVFTMPLALIWLLTAASCAIVAAVGIRVWRDRIISLISACVAIALGFLLFSPFVIS